VKTNTLGEEHQAMHDDQGEETPVKTDTLGEQAEKDLSGIVVSVIMIIVATIALWDTTEMTDSDSYMFPRAVAGCMIAFCITFIVVQLFSPSIGINDEARTGGGSVLRRVGLILAMLSSSLLMPWLGFLISGVLIFGLLMLFAMYDQWTPRRRLVFPLIGIVIVLGFYYMFAELLLVPLPVGTLFE
jgi:putative tricarboxylic transport membrane protein